MALWHQSKQQMCNLSGHSFDSFQHSNCHTDRLLQPNQTCGMAIRIWCLSEGGLWTGCRQWQCKPSRQQVACKETVESLIPLSFPTRSLCPACKQARSALHAAAFKCTHTGLDRDWTDERPCYACCPSWRICSLGYILQAWGCNKQPLQHCGDIAVLTDLAALAL